MADIQLVGRRDFTAGGVTYGAGAVIPPEAYLAWNDGDVMRRVDGGFAQWERVETLPPVIPPTADELDAQTRAHKANKDKPSAAPTPKS